MEEGRSHITTHWTVFKAVAQKGTHDSAQGYAQTSTQDSTRGKAQKSTPGGRTEEEQQGMDERTCKRYVYR